MRENYNDYLNEIRRKMKVGEELSEKEQLILAKADILHAKRSEIIAKANRGETLTQEEQQMYDVYKRHIVQRNENLSEIREKVRSNEPLSDEEQRIYDRYQASKERQNAKFREIREKTINHETLSDEEQQMYDVYKEYNISKRSK